MFSEGANSRLSLNWVFALFVVLGKNPLSARMELIVRVAVWAAATAFLIVLIVMQILLVNIAYAGGGGSDMEYAERLAANLALVTTLRATMVAMVAFLLICAVFSLVVLKRAKVVASFQVQGMTRLLVVSTILFVAVVCQFALFLTSQGFSEIASNRVYLPEWLDLGLDKLLLHGVQSCCLLYTVTLASKQFVHHSAVGKDMREELLDANELEESSNMNREKIPMKYRI